MKTNPIVLKRVLFVDDSTKFLQKLRTKMPTWSRDKWYLSFASDTAKAFSVLETQHVDLVVIDPHMSGMDGLQFLNLVHQKHPHIRKAMLSSFLEQEVRIACLRSGADMYLIKPKRSNGFEGIFHSLNQLFTLSQEGFRGLLRTVSLTDLIQLECLNARSSVLEITSDKQLGRVFIKRGNIIHAQAGSKTGVDAFVRLMHMAGGDFNLKPFVDPGIRTIEMSCDRLLLEASHAVDNGLEQNRIGAADDSNTAWFQKAFRQVPHATEDTTPSVDTAVESINFLQIAEPASDPTDFFPAPSINRQSPENNTANLDTVTQIADELIANRAHLDMKILDMALLKEELNGCRARLSEVICQMQERIEQTDAKRPETASSSEEKPNEDHNPLLRFISSLNEIGNDTSAIVSQLDGFFAAFTEESGNFNETTSKLQNEIARLHTFPLIQQMA